MKALVDGINGLEKPAKRLQSFFARIKEKVTSWAEDHDDPRQRRSNACCLYCLDPECDGSKGCNMTYPFGCYCECDQCEERQRREAEVEVVAPKVPQWRNIDE